MLKKSVVPNAVSLLGLGSVIVACLFATRACFGAGELARIYLNQDFDSGSCCILGAHLIFAAASVYLVVADLVTHRLPDRMVLPTTVILTILLCMAGTYGFDRESVNRAIASAVIAGLLFLTIGFFAGGALGGGDVKLSISLGLMLGLRGWSQAVLALFLMCVVSSAIIAVLVLVKRCQPKSAIPLGPWMLGSAWLGILCGSPLLRN